MTVKELAADLQEAIEAGHGDKQVEAQVFYYNNCMPDGFEAKETTHAGVDGSTFYIWTP